jgi:hypothetical protein
MTSAPRTAPAAVPRAAGSPEPPPLPGQQVRWRHPWRAFALGRFHVYGPGPFEVLAVIDQGGLGPPLALVVQTEFGPREIDAAWLGPAT